MNYHIFQNNLKLSDFANWSTNITSIVHDRINRITIACITFEILPHK